MYLQTNFWITVMKKTSYDLERTPSRYDLERSPGLAFANGHGVEIQFSKNPE